MTPTTFAAKHYTCDMLNPEKVKEAKGLIITVLEEEISPEGLNSIICIRQTKCTLTTEKDDTGKETQVSKCDPPVYTDPVPGGCTPGPTEFCQRVQVLFATSGIQLLMSYIGIIYRWAAGVIGIVSVIYLVWGGFTITTAQNDTTAIDKAKEKIMQSIAGLILLFLSAVILYTINPNFFTLT